MYPVSQAYKTAIRARTRTDSVTGVLTLKDGTVLPLQPQDLISGSLTLDNQCVTGEELAFGCAYMGQAALSLRTELDRYSFYGASLVLTYALQLPDGSWETVQTWTDNCQRLLTARLPQGTRTDGLRLWADRTWGGQSAAVFEIRAYS